MKNILCFGDSNTWGYDGESGKRFQYENRWTSIVQKALCEDYNIIPEGLNGRTTAWEDPFKACRNGLAFLPYALLSHAPLDLVVVMLGTNDTKNYYHNSAFAIGKGIRAIIEMIQASGSGIDGRSPAILVMSPAHIIPGIQEKASFDIREFDIINGFDPVSVSKLVAAEFKLRAGEYGCEFLDAAAHAEACKADGVHLTPDSHRSLAEAVVSKIRSMEL